MWSPYLSYWKPSLVKSVETQSASRPRQQAEYLPDRLEAPSCRENFVLLSNKQVWFSQPVLHSALYYIPAMTLLLGLCVSMKSRGVNNVMIIKWYWRALQISARVSFHAGKINLATTCLILWGNMCVTAKPFNTYEPYITTCKRQLKSLYCLMFFTVWQVAGHAGSTWTIPQGGGTMRPSSACRCYIPVRCAPSLWPSKPWRRLASPRTRPVTSSKCESSRGA